MKVIIVKSDVAPVVEIDTASDSAYVRFKKASKVAKTISPKTTGPLIAIDFDSRDNVIGIELVGVKEFSIDRLLKKVPFLKADSVPLEETRYVSTVRARVEPEFVSL